MGVIMIQNEIDNILNNLITDHSGYIVHGHNKETDQINTLYTQHFLGMLDEEEMEKTIEDCLYGLWANSYIEWGKNEHNQKRYNPSCKKILRKAIITHLKSKLQNNGI